MAVATRPSPPVAAIPASPAAPPVAPAPGARQAPPPVPAWEPFDAEYAGAMVKDLLCPIVERWFRPVILGRERVPAHGPIILASNHSGTALPYDGIVLDGYLWDLDGMRPEAKLRTVFESTLAQAWWLRPFGLDNFWRRCGGVDMTFDNFERLLRRGERVLYFPEGVPGIGKGFQNRYQLQRFHTSFILLAWRHGIPVLPIYTVNGEWIMPFHFTLRPLDLLFQRVFRVPFLPLPAGLLAILFPWLWFLALPARLVFVVGEPVDIAPLVRAEGVADGAEPTREQLQRVAERVRQRMQEQLTQLVAEHGQKPYDFTGLWRALRRAGRGVWGILPTGWPVRFLRWERDRHRAPARNRLHAFVRDLDLAAFYLPFGWPMLSIIKRLRRPPYGYRGLTASERDAIEGNFCWRLSERPLPPKPGAAS